MIPVAKAHEVTIHSPSLAIVAFHSSPYPSHVQGGAVDIFGGKEFGTPVISPVSGEVILIDRSKVGKSRYFDSEPFDYIIALKSKGVCVRILHVEPEVEVGDSIEVSERLGSYIRTPLLPFWSYPHSHVEIKDCKDTASPLYAYPLDLMGSGEFQGSPEIDFDTINAEVILSTENYIIVTPAIDVHAVIGYYWGVAVKVDDEFALLDAQCPWNCYGGLVLKDGSEVREGHLVKIGNVTLGSVIRRRGSLATYALGGELGDGIDRYSKGLLFKDVNRFNVPNKRIKVNGEIFLGISTGLSLQENRTIKLVPTKPLEERYEEGEEVTIEFI
ncbi:MAG: hypothetical protein JSW00_17895 [Thermoplasmata archaeon]|nr:MAG: hypothetical protein JSW00_17895 [Thermoplasmata archaeon]